MSLQLTISLAILFVEVVVILLLVLPPATAIQYRNIINSRFLRALSNQASFYFHILLAIHGLVFVNDICEMSKSRQETTEATHAHLDAENVVSMRLFVAHIQFYVSGSSLLLLLAIRRLVTLTLKEASVMEQGMAVSFQANTFVTTTQSFLAQSRAILAQNDTNEDHKEVTEVKEELAKTEKALELVKKDMEALKNQTESVNKEYDRLNEEYCKLQAMIDAGGEPKKDA